MRKEFLDVSCYCPILKVDLKDMDMFLDMFYPTTGLTDRAVMKYRGTVEIVNEEHHEYEILDILNSFNCSWPPHTSM
jgi:hypothetical protein